VGTLRRDSTSSGIALPAASPAASTAASAGRVRGGGLPSVACGAWHTVAVATGGALYAWGWGRWGQLNPARRTRCTRRGPLSTVQRRSNGGGATSSVGGAAGAVGAGADVLWPTPRLVYPLHDLKPQGSAGRGKGAGTTSASADGGGGGGGDGDGGGSDDDDDDDDDVDELAVAVAAGSRHTLVLTAREKRGAPLAPRLRVFGHLGPPQCPSGTSGTSGISTSGGGGCSGGGGSAPSSWPTAIASGPWHVAWAL